MSRRTRSALASLTVLSVACLGYAAADGPSAAESNVSSKLTTARDALKTIDQMRSVGEHTDPTKHYVWSRRLMEAERAAATTKAERVAATRAHVDRMSRLMKDIRLQFEHAEVSRLTFLDLQYHNDEAVSWWEEEKAK